MKYKPLIKRIAYIILLVWAVDSGYGIYFILGITAAILIWKHKEIWNAMNYYGEYYADFLEEKFKQNKKEKEN